MNKDADNKPKQPMTLRATVEKKGSEPSASSDSGKHRKSKPSLSDRFSWPGRIALLWAVVISPWAFGAWEFQWQFLIVLLLLVGLASWWFETAMQERRSQVFPYLFVPVALGLLLGAFQMLSLPEALGNILLGRQTELNEALITPGTSADGSVTTVVPNSISMNHEGTWHQIRLIIIALSGLVLGCRYFRSKRDLVLLLSTMTINGVALAAFGVLQKLSFNGKIYWVREITMGGSPFGPFVNRNNASGYLLICLACAVGLLPIILSVRKTKGPVNIISTEMPFWRQAYQHLLEFIAELTATKAALLMAVVGISIALFAALSRGGIVALLVASVATILAYGMARKPKNSTFIFIPIVVLVSAIIGWVTFGDELADRFEKINTAEVSQSDLRVRHWQATAPAISDFGMFGAGLGSYREVHRLYRPDNENVIFHHAENQFFQALVEAGWPGLVLFLIAWLLAFQCATLALREGSSPTTIGIGTMGIFLIFSQATASLFDFGFYIPANLLAVSVMFGFLAHHAQALAGRLKAKSWLRFTTPNYIVQVIVLGLFALACYVGVDLFGRSRVHMQLTPRAAFFAPQNLELDETNQKIARLVPLLESKPTTEGLNYLAKLHIHRFRLQLLDKMMEEKEYESNLEKMTAEQRIKYRELLWNLTDVQHIHDYVTELKRTSKYEAGKFLSESVVMENLPMAAHILKLSRRKLLLQPTVHLKLGQIRSLLELKKLASKIEFVGDVDMERAASVAPSNADFRFLIAVYYLQSERPEKAAPHIKRVLELSPNNYSKAMRLLTGRSNRSFPPVDPKIIAEQMLPDDPKMLFNFAEKYISVESPERPKILERVAVLLQNAEIRVQENVILLGDIRALQGDKEAAVDQYDRALLTDPSDRTTRFKRATLLSELNEVDLALEDANYLNENGPKRTRYQVLLNDLRKRARRRGTDRQ